MQAAFRPDQVDVAGRFSDYSRASDEADPSFPPPTESGYHHRRHPWIGLPDSIERDDAGEVWASVHPLYEAGRYAEAVDRGRELLEAYPHPAVFYNLACCESLAGRTAEALEHLRRAIDLAERCRDLAKGDRTSIRSATSPLSRN